MQHHLAPQQGSPYSEEQSQSQSEYSGEQSQYSEEQSQYSDEGGEGEVSYKLCTTIAGICFCRLEKFELPDLILLFLQNRRDHSTARAIIQARKALILILTRTIHSTV